MLKLRINPIVAKDPKSIQREIKQKLMELCARLWQNNIEQFDKPELGREGITAWKS